MEARYDSYFVRITEGMRFCLVVKDLNPQILNLFAGIQR